MSYGNPCRDFVYSNPLESQANLNRANIFTLYENFQRGISISADKPFIGHRALLSDREDETIFGEYQWLSYSEVSRISLWIGCALIHLNQTLFLNPSDAQWTIGMYSVNCPAWCIYEQAANAFSLIVVALYDSLGPGSATYILNHAEISCVACSPNNVQKLLSISKDCPKLKAIFCMGPLPRTSPLYDWAKDRNIRLLDLDEMIELGKAHVRPARPPKPDDLCSICYTSGTTGSPKGVMLTHKNLTSAVQAMVKLKIIFFPGKDRHISYLPLAHVFERVIHVLCIYHGTQIGYFSGNLAKLVDDIKVLQPTLFVSVPRLFNKIYEKIGAETYDHPGLKGFLFRKAYEHKKLQLYMSKETCHPWLDPFLFRKVAAALGGKVRIMLSGSAPISAKVVEFFRICFSCEFFEGYGATETTAMGTFSLPGDVSKGGDVGYPTMGGQIKLKDVPEMNYLNTDYPYPRGEILIRGPYVFKGYYKEPEKTAEVLDIDGWYHSGDIGLVDDTQKLTIVDRKKNIFKLAHGEYIAPERLENVYASHPDIAQVYIHGDPLQSNLVAVVVPDHDKLQRQCDTLKISDINQSLDHPSIREYYMRLLKSIAKDNKLQKYEYLTPLVHLEVEEFSEANGLLTPTMKLKRHDALTKYQEIFNELYRTKKAGKHGSGFFAKL